jgi:hypothetical protein
MRLVVHGNLLKRQTLSAMAAGSANSMPSVVRSMMLAVSASQAAQILIEHEFRRRAPQS